MNGFLKALIAIACVAVVAGGGWFGWPEYQRWSEQSRAKAKIDGARAAVFYQSGAAPGDTVAAKRWCDALRVLVRDELKDNSMAHFRITQCRRIGL